MPEYSYVCLKCHESFSVVRSISKYKPKEKCPKCKLTGNVQRDLETDWDTMHGGVIRGDHEITVGELAKRNSERFSDDYKAALTHKHKTEGYETIEEAQKRTGLDFYGEKGKRNPSEVQKKKDPKK